MNILSQPTAPVLPTNARLLPTTTRQQMALQALAGQPITALAGRHQLSRKFVYQQLDHAHDAIDMRLTETNEIYVIEVNASCYLEQSGEFAAAARAAGFDYAMLIQHIAECACERRGISVRRASKV